MKTIQDILKLSTDFLEKKAIENPRRQAEEVLSIALNIPRLDLYMQFDRPLTDDELSGCREILNRRSAGEPVQYIRGEVEFFECSILVTPDVLIPRQETEILVDKIVKSIQPEGKVLWDLCCGSGCIGIALKKRFPEMKVICSDLSEKALEVAKKNAERNEVEVEFRMGDLFSPFEGEKADYIVSNPPYVTESEYQELSKEVRDYEPRGALVSGPTGIEFYERFGRELGTYLNKNGKVWFEIGTKQGDRVAQQFMTGPWKSCIVEQDWSGHDRFVVLQ